MRVIAPAPVSNRPSVNARPSARSCWPRHDPPLSTPEAPPDVRHAHEAAAEPARLGLRHCRNFGKVAPDARMVRPGADADSSRAAASCDMVDAQICAFASGRRAGQLLAEMPKAKGTRGQAIIRGPSGGFDLIPPEDIAPTIDDLGLTETQSSRLRDPSDEGCAPSFCHLLDCV